MGKGLGEMLERGGQEGVVVELAEGGGQRWQSGGIGGVGDGGAGWGGGGRGARREVRIGHVVSKYLLLYHHIT